MQTIRILQLTDLHVFRDPDARLKGIPTRELLADVIKYITANEAPFDHVIVTGDHTHDELPESYSAVRDLLSGWSERLWQVPGNHDDRGVLSAVFPRAVVETCPDRIQFQFTTGDWLCLGLDTHVPGEVSGRIEESQVAWIRKQLETHPEAPVALFFHHPPCSVNSVWMDRIGLHGAERLQQLAESSPQIRLMCCGHVHHEFHGRIGHADVFTTPSTGIQFDPCGDVPTFATAAPGYRVIEFSGSAWSTHVVRLPEAKYVPSSD